MKNLRNKLVAGILAAALVAVPVGAYAQEALNTDDTAAVMDVDETTEEYAEDAFVDTSYAKASVKDPVVINDMYEQAGDDYAADDESLYDEYDALSGYNYAELLDAVINSGLYECADYEPAAGDVVFYDDVYTDEDGVVWNIEDYGIIEDMSDDGFTIIGNDGDLYDLNPDSVTGYGVLSEADDIENLIDVISEEDAAEEDVTDESSANKDTPDDDIQASEDIETPEDADISDNAATIDDTESGIHVEDPEDASKTDDAAISEVAEMPDVTETPDKNETEKAGDNTKTADDVNDIMPAVINDVYTLVLNDYEITPLASTNTIYFELSNYGDEFYEKAFSYKIGTFEESSFTVDSVRLVSLTDYQGNSVDVDDCVIVDCYIEQDSTGVATCYIYCEPAPQSSFNGHIYTFAFEVTYTRGDADQQAFAIYSATDYSLIFYAGSSAPSIGDTYNGKVVTAVYTGVEDTGTTMPGWASDGYNDDIKTVSFDNSFSNTQPTSLYRWFYDFYENASFDFTNLDTSKATRISRMFLGSARITELDLSGLDTSNVTDMSEMFSGCTNLTTIYSDDNNFVTSSVRDGEDMFYGCTSIVGGNGTTYNSSKTEEDMAHVDVAGNPGYFTDANSGAFAFYSEDDNSLRFYYGSVPEAGEKYDGHTVTEVYTGFDTADYHAYKDNRPWNDVCYDILSVVFDESFKDVRPISTASWFASFENCVEMDLTYLDTSNVTSMVNMFLDCFSLTSLNVSGFNTSNVTNMEDMFSFCTNITSLDLSSFDTSNVAHMSLMFMGCYSLEEVDVSSFNTSNVANMASMFAYCTNLITLDVSNFDTKNASSPWQFIIGADNLEWIKIGENFDLFKRSSSYDNNRMTSIQYWYDSPVNGNVLSDNYMCGISEPGQYWTYTTPEDAFAIYCAEDDSLRFYYGVVPEKDGTYDGHTVTEVYTGLEDTDYTRLDDCPWDAYCSSITNVVIDSSFKNARPISLSWWFDNFKTAEFSGLENIDTSQVTKMNETFGNCDKLINVDELKDWNVSNVIEMKYMFSDCDSLENIDGLAGWNTSSVTSLHEMFWNCTSLESIDALSDWATTSLTDMYGVVGYCSSLTDINLSKWNTKSVTDMAYAFCNCSSLKTLDISGWDTKSVTSYEWFARNCTSLDWINIGDNFDLFAKSSSKLVNQQYWYSDGSAIAPNAVGPLWYAINKDNENGKVVSNNYMIGIDGAGKYWTHTTGSITVKKVDADTNESLGGAEFALASNSLSNGSFNFMTDESGQYTIDIYADSDGYVTLYDKNENVISNSNVSSLDCTLTETKAPDGYTISNETKEFTISPVVNKNLVYEYTIEDKRALYSFNLNKTDTDGGTITGAEFTMYDSDDEPLYFTVSDGEYTLCDPATDGSTSTITAGNVSIDELEAGMYYLKETKAPDGHILLTDSVEFTIGEDGLTLIDGSAFVDEDMLNVVNAKGAVLPNAGGMRTLWGIIIGSAVVAAGAVYVATESRRRKKAAA